MNNQRPQKKCDNKIDINKVTGALLGSISSVQHRRQGIKAMYSTHKENMCSDIVGRGGGGAGGGHSFLGAQQGAVVIIVMKLCWKAEVKRGMASGLRSPMGAAAAEEPQHEISRMLQTFTYTACG